MGRGRAKAKQTKVARDLKYRTYEPDLDALQRELSAQKNGNGDSRHRSDDDEEPDEAASQSGDDYDDYYADEPVNRN